MWGIVLSDPLPVVALVGRDPTNELMGRRPLSSRTPVRGHSPRSTEEASLLGIGLAFAQLFPAMRQVAYVLLTLPPLSHSCERDRSTYMG